MRTLLAMEEMAMTLLGIYGLWVYNLGLPSWIWIPLFLAPDVSMLGYLINSKTGAILYNLFHHKGIALGLFALGYAMHLEILMTIGILIFAHSSLDRTLGYGLKYPDSFSHTHLGYIGKSKK